MATSTSGATASPETGLQSGTSAPSSAPTTSTPTTSPSTVSTIAESSLSGKGDDVVTLPRGIATESAVLLTITYKGSRNFVVEQLDEANSTSDLLVNVIGSYAGTVPLELSEGSTTNRLKVTASGAWTIVVHDITTARPFISDIGGKGDDVLLYAGDAATASITHTGKSNFAIELYNKQGHDLLVNEIGSYSGRQPLPGGGALLVVHADGTWSIKTS